MNPVGELLHVDGIDLELDVADRPALLERVAGLLARRYGLVEREVLEGLSQREQIGSTALGHGVAIPHARMAQCRKAAAVFVRTKFPIPFDAPDNKPVSVFLAVLVPRQATEQHLQLLATAATMFNDRAFRERLRTCPDPGSACELLAAWPDSPGAMSNPIAATPAA